MLSVDISLAAPDGTPASAIARLIDATAKATGKDGFNAACAALVTALRSIRARTKIFRPSRIKRSDIELDVTPLPLVPSFTSERFASERDRYNNKARYVERQAKGDRKNLRGSGAIHKVCLRDRQKVRQTIEADAKIRPFVPPTEIAGSFVFRVTWKDSEGGHIRYGIAPNRRTVTDGIIASVRKKAAKHAGLARRAIGLGMARIAGTRVPSDTTSPGTRAIADTWTRLVVKRPERVGGDGEIRFEDNLDYAVLAINGGEATVDLALKKAANLMTKRLALYIERRGFSSAGLQSPFPEVKGAR